MTWKLPEDQNKPKPDPWTGRQPDNKPKGQQPPDIDALLRQAWTKLKRRYSNWRSLNSQPRAWLTWLAGVALAIWLGLGVHYVRGDQLSYVLRLGVYQGQLATGWQWRAWGIYQVYSLPQPQALTVKPEVISQDLNLAKVSMTLTYRVIDPKAYLFSNNAPLIVLQALSDSALQQVVGQMNSDALLSEKNPPTIVTELKPLLQSLVDQAGLGVQIVSIQIDDVAIPDSLQELFTKMNALYETQTVTRQKNLEYQQQVLPAAVLKAKSNMNAAKAYAQQTIAKAQSDVADYLLVLPQYEKNPQLIKYQLYTQNMTEILSASQTVVVDAKGTTPMIVLNDAMRKKPLAPVNSTAATAISVVDNSDADTINDSYGNIKGGYGS